MKSPIRIASFLLVLTAALGTVTSCSASVDDLVGTFGIFENGRVSEYFRVEKRDGKYYLNEKANGRWGSPAEMKIMTQQEIVKAMGSSENASQLTGLMDLGGNVAMLKCKAGLRFGNFTSQTGYWAGTMLGPIELHKM
jgi:hypothetical protein